MPRETKEQREAREALELEARMAATAVFRETLPKRLMDAQALANAVDVFTEVKLLWNGPQVHFYDGNKGVDTTLNYFSEEWEVDELDTQLEELRKEQEACMQRRDLAMAAWRRLTEAERSAVKEFYKSLIYQ